MKKNLNLLVVSAVLSAFAVSVAAAPPKKSTNPKQKPKTNSGQLASKGTSQLPGQWCEFGKSYTLGKSTSINFVLKSAEYRVGRIKTGDTYTFPNAGRKLLVIRGSLHNCMNAEQWAGEGSLKMTAVDGDSQNVDFSSVCVETTQRGLDQQLKPAQKIDVYYVIDVPAKGEIPKLMVANAHDPSAPIARYDLRGKVGKLEETFRDPADSTGATALNEVPVKIGTVFELGDLNIKVETASFRDTAFADQDLPSDSVNLLFTIEATNFSVYGKNVSATDTIYQAKLVDSDGATYEESIRAISASSDREVALELGTGKTIRYRSCYTVPKGVQLKTLSFNIADGRILVVDVSSLKS